MYYAKSIIPRSVTRSPALRRAVRRALDISADLAEVELARPARRYKKPVTFTQTSPDEFSRVVGTNSDIYVFNDQGTKPHKIRARRSKRLSFVWRGRRRFPIEVNHPGTKARYFARRAAEVVQREMQGIFDAELAGAV